VTVAPRQPKAASEGRGRDCRHRDRGPSLPLSRVPTCSLAGLSGPAYGQDYHDDARTCVLISFKFDTVTTVTVTVTGPTRRRIPGSPPDSQLPETGTAGPRQPTGGQRDSFQYSVLGTSSSS
jgi:hypothetical protein